MHNDQLEGPYKGYDWVTLMSLFDEISALPEVERTTRIIEKELDEGTLKQLQKMLNTLDLTVSLLDQPIANRIEFDENWFAENWVGTQLNGYSLDSLLHANGITGVFKASQEEPVHREVVVKLLRPDTPAEHVDFFRFEQLALAKLTHPNIAVIHTVEKTEQGVSFIVMEYIEGASLSVYCDEQALSIRERLKVFLSICDAITYSHQRGILHRDLKSSNILVRDLQGKHTPTIIDFGISSDLNKQSYLLQDQVVGTPEYMSPEHVLDANAMDARADVYSLGMVLFSLLVGRIPFNRDTISGMNQAKRVSLIAEFTPLPPSAHYGGLSPEQQQDVALKRRASTKSVRKDLSKDLDFIFLKATQKDKETRYQSVADLSTDLRQYLNHEAVGAHPPSPLYQFKKFVVRNSIASLAALAIAVLGLLFLVKLVDQNQQIKAEVLLAKAEKKNAEQISVMVMDTLGVANPTGVKSQGKASVESMIDQTSEHLRSNQEISPDFRAKLLVKLSEAYRGIGNVEKAKGIEGILLNEIDSYTPVSKVNALLTLADSAELDTDHYAGLGFAKRAHDLCIANDIQGITLIKSKDALARVYSLLSEFDKAEMLLQDALSLFKQESSVADNTVLAGLYLSLADMTISQGTNFAKAERYYAQGKNALSKQYGEEHARVVEVEIDEVQLLVLSRSPKLTSQRIENVYKKIVAIWGKDSKNANLISYHLATSYRAQGEIENAIKAYRGNLNSLQAQNIRYGVLNIANMFGLAGSYLEADEFKNALSIASELHQLVTEKNNLGVEFTPYHIAMAKRQYSAALAANAMFDEALHYSESSIPFFKDKSESTFAISLSLRAYTLAMLDRFDQAKDDMQQAVVQVQSKPEEHSDKSQTTLLTRALQLYIDFLSDGDASTFARLSEVWDKYEGGLDGNAIEFPYSEVGKFLAKQQ